MPQAAPELQDEMERLFGDPISERGPMQHLEAQGYVLTEHWFWRPPPSVTTYDQMAEDDWLCLKFLMDEWDFGGLESAR